MKLTHITVAAAIGLTTIAMPAAQARNRSGHEEESSRQTLEEIRQLARAASDNGVRLKTLLTPARDSFTVERDALTELKDEVNRMGRDISRMESQRDSLPAWEQQACDRVLPLVQDAASTTSSAIAYLNDNPSHLFATQNLDLLQRLNHDTSRISSTLKDYLAYEKVQQEEQTARTRIESDHN
jgi:septal ring factor EnvC (AmiA/AmiB activator)